MTASGGVCGGRDCQEFSLTVINPNLPPVISSSPVTSGRECLEYQYQMVASDPDGDALIYSLASGPAGMTVNASGLVQWTPDEAGSVPVSISVSDGKGGRTFQSFTLVIEPQPNSCDQLHASDFGPGRILDSVSDRGRGSGVGMLPDVRDSNPGRPA